MRIIVTRPEPDASAQADQLRALGHEAIVAPLLVAQSRGVATSAVVDAEAVAVTSRNALRALDGSPALQIVRFRPLYCVGPGTAELARQMGCEQVIACDGDARALAAAIRAARIASDGPIVHLAGDRLAYDLAADLREAGLHVRTYVAYFMKEAASLGADVEAAIASGTVDGVMLMSPRTAETYVHLVEKAGLPEAARALVHFCLSDNVAAGLAALAPSRVVTATHPRNEEIIALVTRVATGRV